MDLVLDSVTKNYARFAGRARRKEYWLFILVYIILAIIGSVLDNVLGLFDEATGIGPISGIVTLALIVPSIAVCVRRLHDTGRSGFWFWLWLIPLIGSIWLFVLMCLKGTDGENDHGPDPITAAT